MVDAMPSAVAGLDRPTLTGPVRHALDRPAAEVIDWESQPLDYRHVNPITAGLHRITGTARDGGTPVAWSLVLKITQPLADAARAAVVPLFSLTPAELDAVEDTVRWDRTARRWPTAPDCSLRSPPTSGRPAATA